MEVKECESLENEKFKENCPENYHVHDTVLAAHDPQGEEGTTHRDKDTIPFDIICLDQP